MYFILGQAWGLDKNLLSAMCLGHPRNVSYTFYSVPDGTVDSLDTAVLSIVFFTDQLAHWILSLLCWYGSVTLYQSPAPSGTVASLVH